MDAFANPYKLVTFNGVKIIYHMTSKRDLVRDYIRKNNEFRTPTRRLARMIIDEMPELFSSFEIARSCINDIRRAKPGNEFAIRYRGIDNAAEESDVNTENVKHGWLKSKNHTLFFVNPDYENGAFDPDKIDWPSILEPLKITKQPPAKENDLLVGLFDRIVYTDTHIGMDPNPNGFSLYGGKWDEAELMSRLQDMVNHTIANQSSNTLIIDDLGDFVDGWDNKTVRREHDLEQNMDNQKMFDVGLSFKVKMVDLLSKHYKKIICHNVCNDNHAGAFGYVINSAFKEIVSLKHENVEVINYRKFIDHYSLGDYTFVISHGKDETKMKRGFPAKIDPATIEKIDNYIKENYLFQKGVEIEFSKGDSHQYLFDYSSSDVFNYFNFPAFSPSSMWVQGNYKKGKSGFVMFNYLRSQVITIPHFFSWKD